ncbi:hypothetical protein Agabi119p4_4294 [Agaricus bisporus var. burnettii]|uniref:Uncharacterized protein n=1 Tax=Agaricus bisporus var. burnettii TaxID=192524 RepID=A0A8H7F326_AGABI|nr:hypothetical protein Agabi119p4_4294 [Agaricus bisporus var. burnettii]
MPAPPAAPARHPRHPARHPRGPLQELPIDQFLLTPSSSKLASSTKRPVSPGTPVLYTPAKRRILNEEGFFAVKTPLSASALASSSKQPLSATQHQQPQSFTRFADALMGPDSPARKLDFGTPKNARTPGREAAGEILAPSSPVQTRSRSRVANCQAEEDCFSTSSQSYSQHPQSPPETQMSFSSSSSFPSQRHLDFMSVPRELPPLVDPQSEHYPGFVVHQDPFFLLPVSRLAPPQPLSTSSSVPTVADDCASDGSDAESVDARDVTKENLPPPRRACKAAMGPSSETLFSPPSAKSSVLATPHREASVKEKDILTPRRLSIFGVGVGSVLGMMQHTPSKQDRRNMRKILEEEIDGEQND